MTSPVTLAGLGTAVPSHVLRQEDALAFARQVLVAQRPSLSRMLPVFHRAGVRRRFVAASPAFHLRAPSPAARNALYVEAARDLACRSAQAALDEAGIRPAQVAAVVLASSTGIAAPGIDRDLAEHLGLPAAVRRLPLWGLGCAGGAAALGHGAALCRGIEAPILVVAVETCSLTFLPEDTSRANLIACALFGDGAAAAVLVPAGRGPAVVAAASHRIPNTADAMGWDVVDHGLKVRFAPTLPGIVRSHVGDAVRAARERADTERLHRFVLHPGGPKILAAYREVLRPDPRDLSASAAVLSDYGNMSSATVLFVLEGLRRDTPPNAGELAALLALGPGLSMETVVLRWN